MPAGAAPSNGRAGLSSSRIVGVLGIVTLLLTAFGSGTPRASGMLSTTAGAAVVPGDTQPEPQVLAPSAICACSSPWPRSR